MGLTDIGENFADLELHFLIARVPMGLMTFT
ncbi:hypothetical protein A2U01_0053402, partial [Trifolium medium]|nr:hypothetical protein [Trifolium medium]